MSLESLYDNVSIEWGACYRDTRPLTEYVDHGFEPFPTRGGSPAGGRPAKQVKPRARRKRP